MAKQETIAYHTMVPVCFFLARSAFKIHSWHQFLHAMWNESRSTNQPSTGYMQSGPRVGTLELSSFVPFYQSTQSLREKRTTKHAHSKYTHHTEDVIWMNHTHTRDGGQQTHKGVDGQGKEHGAQGVALLYTK